MNWRFLKTTSFVKLCLIVMCLTRLMTITNAQTPDQPLIKLVSNPKLKNSSLSLSILDKKNGELVVGHNTQTSLTPASSLKILTCIYGLKVLGSNFKFKTTLEYSGHITPDGVLQGDLYIKGHGDPTLGSELAPVSNGLQQTLLDFVDAIKKEGIKKIDGNIIGDATFYSDQGIYDSWAWNDIGNYYGAGIYGLNIYDNLYKLTYKLTAQNKKPAIASQYPASPALTFQSDVICAGPNSGDNAYIFGGPMEYRKIVRGTIPSGTGTFDIKGSQPDPSLTAAILLKQSLKDQGIESNDAIGSLSSPMPQATRKTLATFYSRPLKEIVEQTLLKSINLYAEGILRYCVKEHKPGQTIEPALNQFVDYLKKESQVTSGFILSDGSGLSRANVVTSLGMSRFVWELTQEPSLYQIMENALPVAGQTGTLKNYLISSPAKGKIKAKTGSMEGVRSFTGVLTGQSGKEYIFSLIINNYECTSSQIKKIVEDFWTEMFQAL